MNKVKMLFSLLAIQVFLAVEAFARAGGGHSSGGRSSSGHSSSRIHSSSGSADSNPLGILIIVGSFLGIFALLITIASIQRKKRIQQTKEILNQSSAQDSLWNEKELKEHIEKSFFKIQEAWMVRDQDIAKEFMSKKLYDKHKIMTDRMLYEKKQNILKDITLLKCDIIHMEDYVDNNSDCFWVEINASLIDFTIDEITGHILPESNSSTKNTKTSFNEI